jgi:hypothetical protein
MPLDLDEDELKRVLEDPEACANLLEVLQALQALQKAADRLLQGARLGGLSATGRRGFEAVMRFRAKKKKKEE